MYILILGFQKFELDYNNYQHIGVFVTLNLQYSWKYKEMHSPVRLRFQKYSIKSTNFLATCLKLQRNMSYTLGHLGEFSIGSYLKVKF